MLGITNNVLIPKFMILLFVENGKIETHCNCVLNVKLTVQNFFPKTVLTLFEFINVFMQLKSYKGLVLLNYQRDIR